MPFRSEQLLEQRVYLLSHPTFSFIRRDHLSISSLSTHTLLTMTTYNETCSLPSQPPPSHPISIADIFFPGLTGISVVLERLLAGNVDSYAGLLCICGMLIFSCRYAYQHFLDVVESYFSLWIRLYHQQYFLMANSFNTPCSLLK